MLTCILAADMSADACVMPLQTGSWFELANKNAIFGVLKPDNPLYSIILGTFGVTGYPTAGLLLSLSAPDTHDNLCAHCN